MASSNCSSDAGRPLSACGWWWRVDSPWRRPRRHRDQPRRTAIANLPCMNGAAVYTATLCRTPRNKCGKIRHQGFQRGRCRGIRTQSSTTLNPSGIVRAAGQTANSRRTEPECRRRFECGDPAELRCSGQRGYARKRHPVNSAISGHSSNARVTFAAWRRGCIYSRSYMRGRQTRKNRRWRRSSAELVYFHSTYLGIPWQLARGTDKQERNVHHKWIWNLRCYYGKSAMRPGHVAFETAHTTQALRDAQIDSWTALQDIGCIESREVDGSNAWEVIWRED